MEKSFRSSLRKEDYRTAETAERKVKLRKKQCRRPEKVIQEIREKELNPTSIMSNQIVGGDVE